LADESPKPIRTISSREVYRNKWSRWREDIIECPDGQRGVYAVLDKDPACIVIPLEHSEDGDYVWLVRQYRYTVGASFYELPQGGWEDPHVDIEEMARGELREETGLTAARMTPVTKLWIAYGAMHQIHHVYLAEGLAQGETDRDEEEHDMTVHRVRIEDFEAMLLDGRVMDNCTAAAWGVYLVWKQRSRTAEQRNSPA
jgi:ADP-ribose pyrophosphatase